MRAISKALTAGTVAACLLAALAPAQGLAAAPTVAPGSEQPTAIPASAQPATTPPSQGGDPNAPTPPPGKGGPVVEPVRSADQSAGAAASASSPPACCPPPGQMSHGSGNVLRGYTRVAIIYWGPNWNGDPRLGTVDNMWHNVGVNSWTDVLLEYWDNISSTDDTGNTFAGSWVDLGSAPAATYTIADVNAEAQRAINLHFGYDPNTLYLVYANNGAHTDQNACGWHYWGSYNSQPMAYGTVDYGRCQVSVAGAAGDVYTQGLTKVGLHEFAEGVTDPFGNAWGQGQNGQEVGDLCDTNYIGINFGGTVYAGQQIYGNNEGACLSSKSVTYSYKWISQSYTPNPMAPRSYYAVNVVVQNTGTVQWPVRSILHFGTDSPQDRCSAYYDGGSWLGCTRIGGLYNQANSSYSTVQPGQNAVFSFYFYANPSRVCSTSNEHFNLVMEGRLWFGSAGIYWPLTEGCYNGSFNSETLPSPGLVAGDNSVTNTTKIRFVNTGNLPWNNDGFTALVATGGCSMFYDSLTWINCNTATAHVINVSNSSKSWVDPGEVGEFDVVLNVPPATLPGSYSQQWVINEQGIQTMGSSYHTSTYSVLA